jgi:predicted ATPase
MIINRQTELEAQSTSSDRNAIFYDRGIPDYLAMLRLTETEIPKELWEAAHLHPYDYAFVCETLSSFDSRAATGRSLNRTASLKLQSLCLQIYEELNCPVITLKESSVEERMQLIEDSLDSEQK